MSAGGINVQQPLVAPPSGGVQAIGQPQLPPATAAGPVTAPAPGASSGAATPTGFTPVPGMQAGSVAPSGGLVDDGLPRTAAIGAALATNAAGNRADANAAAATIASAPVPGRAALDAPTGGATPTAPAGPAAWDETWAKKFKDAGAPAEVLQQLRFTGAMGADAARLEQMLGQIKGEVDTQLAKFAHEHPDEFKKLRANPAVDRGMVAQVAAGVNAGQVPAAQLHQLVESVGKSQGKMIFDMFVKPMIVWSLIPGWGAIRVPIGLANGGKDPLTGEKMFGDKMMTGFTVLAGIGGSFTLFNHARGAMQVAQGHRLVTAGGDAARIAAAEGFANVSFGQKLASFLPGTQANKVFAGVSRLDQKLTDGIKALNVDGAGSIERELAENVLTKWRRGEISILGDPASKFGFMGYQPNARGILLGRNKVLAKPGVHGSMPTIVLDGRMTGKTLAAHLAAAGVEFADDTLRTKLFRGVPQNADAIKHLRERTLGNATQQLLKNGYITVPNGLQKVVGAVRPGPLQDALWAADNVAAGTIGKLHGTAAIPKGVKFGVGGALAAGAGYYMMVKMPKDAAKKQQEEAAKAQGGAAGQAGQAPASPELEAALQQFAALPKEQQAQIIQQQYATLQQASQQPNLTPEQQQQIVAEAAKLERFMQVANGGAAPPAATAGQAPASPELAPEFETALQQVVPTPAVMRLA